MHPDDGKRFHFGPTVGFTAEQVLAGPHRLAAIVMTADPEVSTRTFEHLATRT